MLAALKPGQVIKAVVSPTAKGQPSSATLTEDSFSTSDPTVCTIVPDPDVKNGCIITGVGSGSQLQATITANALATEVDGRTNNVSGTDTITCELLPPPPDAADALVFTLTPIPVPPVPPPNPVG